MVVKFQKKYEQFFVLHWVSNFVPDCPKINAYSVTGKPANNRTNLVGKLPRRLSGSNLFATYARAYCSIVFYLSEVPNCPLTCLQERQVFNVCMQCIM